MKTVSLIVPCYNEEKNIEPFYDAILHVFEELEEDFELLFVNDGSKDNTLSKIRELNSKDKRVKGVSFARNFGKEAGLFAGADGNVTAKTGTAFPIPWFMSCGSCLPSYSCFA